MESKFTELYEKLSRLQWLLHRHHLQNHLEHGPFGDPTRGQGRVLAMLKMQPEISTKDLSYLLGIRQQSLNELLNKLEKAGYVVRVPSESDRRVMMVKLTEKGEAQERADTDFSGIFDCLDQEEQAAFGDYLDRVIAALEARLGVDEDEEELENRLRAARSRMGNDMFERMMSLRGGFGRHGHDPHGRGFFNGAGPDGRCPHHFGEHPGGGHPGGPHNQPSSSPSSENPHEPEDE